MHNGHSEIQGEQLRFDQYVLDRSRGCLLRDGEEVSLRPKTFAVLDFLVRNSGRLVAKDELFAAVWPNLAVTDDVLVQSIGELRRALGEDGARLVRTIPRRGYRFEGRIRAPGSQPIEQRQIGTAPYSQAGRPTPALSRSHILLLAGASFVAILLTAGLRNSSWIHGNDAARNGIRIQGSGTAQTVSRPAVAVLPFVSQSGDPTRDHFVDGLTQDVISALGRFSGLTVMSWNAVLPFKAKPPKPQEVGRALSVGYVVEASVRRDEDRVRVTAQLVHASQGRVLWSARMDEHMYDVFALQDSLAKQIVIALAGRLTHIELNRAFARPTENLEAYDYVLRARPALHAPTRANNAEARTLLRRALELDPNYAAAYSALAETYYIAAAMGWAESATAFLDRAEEFATKAVSLDELDVRGRALLGRLHISHQRYKEARAEIDRALAVNPNDAQAIAGRGNILVWLGEVDLAIETLEEARRIDPELSPIDRFALSLAYYLRGDYQGAVEQSEINLRKTAGANFSRVVLAAGLAQQNRMEDVAKAVAALRRSYPAFEPEEFGTKFLNATNLEHLRQGLRKAGLYPIPAAPVATGN